MRRICETQQDAIYSCPCQMAKDLACINLSGIKKEYFCPRLCIRRRHIHYLPVKDPLLQLRKKISADQPQTRVLLLAPSDGAANWTPMPAPAPNEPRHQRRHLHAMWYSPMMYGPYFYTQHCFNKVPGPGFSLKNSLNIENTELVRIGSQQLAP